MYCLFLPVFLAASPAKTNGAENEWPLGQRCLAYAAYHAHKPGSGPSRSHPALQGPPVCSGQPSLPEETCRQASCGGLAEATGFFCSSIPGISAVFTEGDRRECGLSG